MIDYLKEIVGYTHSLGFLELVKVTGTRNETTLMSIASDRSVFLSSKFKTPLAEMVGVFGMNDLGRLATILNIPEYKENANIQINYIRDEPVSISFNNMADDFKNEYRFMSRQIIETQLPDKTRKTIHWDISIIPSLQSIMKLKYQAQAVGNAVGTFQVRTNNQNLLFSLGDKSSHTGEFVFSHNIHGSLKTPRSWPLSQVQGILNLHGDKTIDISDNGIMQIVVNSGLAEHQYSIFASII